MLLDTQYELGDIVYLKTDADQFERQVTAITISLSGGVTYTLMSGVEMTYHYEKEITKEKNYV